MTRSIDVIAKEIVDDWRVDATAKGKTTYPHGSAFPYVKAMAELESLDDFYGLDTARSVVLYFLANAGTWRGETARRIKAELKAMLAEDRKAR